MALPPGTRLGSYEIAALVGEGGMGQVYRARDTRLNRDVALKVLHESFANDPDRLARFQREAQVLASLNHPNIAHIHGLEDSNRVRALVMELVEGPTLADLVARGAIPLDEALPIARQIAEAMEAAHEQGIIHRDLKPANIKIRGDGCVKVLDFGLAKALDPTPGATADATSSPTLSVHATMAGMILGTAAYMSPEQARGKTVDRRADIWAFGAILYEMLTGRRAFDGDDVSITLAAVMMKDVDWTALPANTPLSIRQLIRRCLDRDVTTRLRDIGEARIAIQQYVANPKPEVANPSPAPAVRVASRLPWALVTVSTAALAVLAVLHFREKPVERPRVHFSIPGDVSSLALSPDGQWLVTTTGSLSLRSLRTGEVRALPGTTGARAPFWSADSRTIGYFSFLDRSVKMVAVSGGSPQVVCEGIEAGSGGTWSQQGVILFTTGRGSLVRTSADGGKCTEIEKEQPGFRRAPVFLPDGEHFLFGGNGSPGILVASLSDPVGKRLLPDTSSALFVSDPLAAHRGRILFLREQTLMAQAFDTRSLALSGEPSHVAEGVGGTNTGSMAVSVANDGTLAYRTRIPGTQPLGFFDRSGKQVEALPVNDVRSFALSPDSRQLAYTRVEDGKASLWLYDFERRQESKLTDSSIDARVVVWTGNLQRLAYSGGGPQSAIFVKDVNSVGAGDIVMRGGVGISDWSRDNRWLVYSTLDEKTGSDLWLLADPLASPAAKPLRVAGTAAIESQGQISPDGKWLAYYSSESAPGQVYLTPLSGATPVGTTRWQVSTVRGTQPRWSADGKELYYLEPGGGLQRVKLMAVPIGSTSRPNGKPIPLFDFDTQRVIPQANVFNYVPSSDGRFLLNTLAGDLEPSLEIIVNWATTQP